MDYALPALFEPATAEEERRALDAAEAEIAAGNFVPHADVKRWVKSWGKAGELPRPRPRTWQR